MTQSTDLAKLCQAGDSWLADCSADPSDVRAAWRANALAPIASGGHWRVAESRLVTGMPAVVRIREERRGPVLVDGVRDTAWWLVPLVTEELADVRQLRLLPPDRRLYCPRTDAYAADRFWLCPPDGSGRLNDPAVMAAAFGPGWHRVPAEGR